MGGDKIKIAAVAVLAVLALAFAYVIFFGQAPEDKQATKQEFMDYLMSSKDVYVMANLDGSPQASRTAIMQCGVELTGSINVAAAEANLPEKNVTFIVLDGSQCYLDTFTKDRASCIALARNGASIEIKYGNGTISYYTNKMVITMDRYYSACSVSASNSVQQNISANSSVP